VQGDITDCRVMCKIVWWVPIELARVGCWWGKFRKPYSWRTKKRTGETHLICSSESYVVAYIWVPGALPLSLLTHLPFPRVVRVTQICCATKLLVSPDDCDSGYRRTESLPAGDCTAVSASSNSIINFHYVGHFNNFNFHNEVGDGTLIRS
jgi:hypothetical protein